jgi:UDP-N-acetylmuramoyl-L-alanyl-D-glutamate--2,6-diaminopimelate ligase
MPAEGVTLRAVAAAIGADAPEADVTVSAVHHDTRSVEPGSLFVAIAGSRSDGHDLVADAVAAGAVALVVERPVAVAVPQLVVPDSRAALPLASVHVYGNPARQLTVIGVTGTNGKTTVTHFLETIVNAAGGVPGVVGTLGARIAAEPFPLERTTPESNTVQQLLAAMVDAGVTVAALEVSSHALAMGRVDGMRFDVAAFTNLSQDHLDFHHTMEEYFATKVAFFSPDRATRAVVYVDDPWGKRLAGMAEIPVTTVGSSPRCDVWVSDIENASDHTAFVLHDGAVETAVTMPLLGHFNVANAAIAAAAGLQVGIDLGSVAAGLAELRAVPGRLEVVPGPAPFTVVVDYAHTPEAITAVIAEMRSILDGRVIVVVGAAGDRDRHKRPLMGQAAAGADVAVLTSDNPRSEDPAAILAEVATGARQAATLAGPHLVTELDRRRAIRAGLEAATRGDAVLILGKGHESGQEFGEGRIEPFDDRQVAREEMAALAGVGGP